LRKIISDVIDGELTMSNWGNGQRNMIEYVEVTVRVYLCEPVENKQQIEEIVDTVVCDHPLVEAVEVLNFATDEWHVRPSQGRRIECWLCAHLGPLFRISTQILFADRWWSQPAADVTQVRLGDSRAKAEHRLGRKWIAQLVCARNERCWCDGDLRQYRRRSLRFY